MQYSCEPIRAKNQYLQGHRSGPLCVDQFVSCVPIDDDFTKCVRPMKLSKLFVVSSVL